MSIPTTQARVTGLQVIAPGVCELTLAPLGAPIHFAPGQWLSIHFPIGPRPPLIRAYSLALPESPSGELVLCTDLVAGGLGSGYLHQLEIGNELTIAGPFGNFVLPDPPPAQLLLAARFTGIVPLRCILRQLAARDWPVKSIALVYGAPTPAGLVYHAELAALAESCPGFDYFPITGDGADGTEVPEMPEIVAVLRALRTAAPEATLVPMVSGVKDFVRPVRAALMEIGGFERRAVRIESYD
ncbi:MAG TPA: FAD-dependent oxidoreductase [Candidatus Udaeobacter sp.]|nr:FAD-dependent oxidoreductase [Candidatus Udaeobacter sp.]